MAGSAIEAGRAFLKLLVDDKEFASGLDAGLQKLNSFGKSALQVGASIGAAGAAITAPFIAGLKVFSDTGSALNDMSDRTGVSVERLSELKYVAQQTGTDLSAVEGALRKMSKTLSNAADGSRTAIEALRGIGIEVKDIIGLSPEQQFDKIARALATIQDPTARAATAMEILGKNATLVLPGIANLDNLSEEARKAGVVMSTQAAKDADAYGDSIDRLKAQLSAMAAALGGAVAPALTNLADAISPAVAAVIEFIKNNEHLARTLFFAGAAMLAVSTALLAVFSAAKTAEAGIIALRVAITLLSKNPWVLLLTVALGALLVALGPVIDKWLGMGEANNSAADSTKKNKEAQDALAAAVGRGTKKIDERAAAMERLNKTERFWAGQADQRAKAEKDKKQEDDLRVTGLNEQIRSIDASIASAQSELNRENTDRKRVEGEQKEGGSPRRQAIVAEVLAQNEERRKALAARIADFERQRREAVGSRDELTGDAAKKREEFAKQEAERQAAIREQQAEAAKQFQEAREKQQQTIKAAASSIFDQFSSFGRSIRGGVGGQFAQQIGGTSSTDAREERALKIADEARGFLKEIKDVLTKGQPLLIGAT